MSQRMILCVWLLEDCGTTSLGTGRVSLETVTREGCHRNMDHCRLPVAMPGDRQRQGMHTLSGFLPRAQTPERANLLGMAACSLTHGAYLLAGSGGFALYVLRDRYYTMTS
jgi:hypothetical protein